jgi:hypothetical protein
LPGGQRAPILHPVPAPHLEPIVLRLRGGVELPDALATALEFIERDGTYQAYDLAAVKQDDVLTVADVRVGNAIIARMPARVIAAFAERALPIEAALASIPPTSSLMASEGEIPWGGLRQLLEAANGISEVGLPRATKVLHKKRPSLIPILDSVVDHYLRHVEGLPRHGDFVADGLELIRAYKRELDASADALSMIRGQLSALGFELTECRLLDIYLWAYSGTYTPAWQRGSTTDTAAPYRTSGQDAGARKRHRSSSPIDIASADASLSIFKDDEAAYAIWLASHANGFVLNAHRNPGPSYLVLHRASCRTIGGNPTRGRSWTRDYIKLCSNDETVLDNWAEKSAGGAPRRCRVCME